MTDFRKIGKGITGALTKASEAASKAQKGVLPAAERDANLAKMLESSNVKERLYHGTGRDIQKFDKSKLRRTAFGEGFHLAESPNLANFYANQFDEGQNVMPVYAAIKNPYELKSMHDWYDIPGANDTEKTNLLKSQGYDGIKYPHGAGDDKTSPSPNVYVAFEPEQIKSAISNRGTYDITDPDISKAKGGVLHMADAGKVVKGGLKAIQAASKAADEQLAAGKLKAALEAQQAPMTTPSGTGLPLMPRDNGMYTLREQKDLPRMPMVDKARAAGVQPNYNERMQDLLDSPKARKKVDKLINKGKALGVQEWYGTEPLRQVTLNAGRTPEQFDSMMAQFASASQRNPVDKQNQMGSYLYYLSETGQLPADSLLLTNKLKEALKADPSLAQGRTLVELPKGYGSLAQGDIFNRAVMIGQGDIAGALPPNKKLGTFYENLLGNVKPVTVDVNALRGPIIEQGDPRWLTSKLVEKDEKGKVINTYKPREMYNSGEMSMREAQQRPGFWEAAPSGSEYAGFEDLWTRGAKRHNIEPAEAQALGWYGSADVTALKTKPENYVDNLERLIRQTAEQTGKSPTEVLNDMVTGKGFLRKEGGAVNSKESPEDMALFHKRFALHKATGGKVNIPRLTLRRNGVHMDKGGDVKDKSWGERLFKKFEHLPKVGPPSPFSPLDVAYGLYKYKTGAFPIENWYSDLEFRTKPRSMDTGSVPVGTQFNPSDFDSKELDKGGAVHMVDGGKIGKGITGALTKASKMADEKIAADAIGKAAESAGMKAPVTANKPLTNLQDFHTSLGDQVREGAVNMQKLVESMPYKYDKGQRVFTEDSAKRNKPPYTVLHRVPYGNQPMREDHPDLAPGNKIGNTIKDPITGKTQRTPYEPGYRVRYEDGDKWSQFDIPESAIKGDVEMARGGRVQESPEDIALFHKRFALHKATGGKIAIPHLSLKRVKKFNGGGIASPEESSASDGKQTYTGLMAEYLAKAAKDQGKEELSSLSKPRAATDLLNRGVLANNPLSAMVDLVNMGLVPLDILGSKLTGRDIKVSSDKPFLGSEHLKDLMKEYNITSGEERPMMETALSFASPVGMIKGAQKTADLAKKAPEALNTVRGGLETASANVQRPFRPATLTMEAVAPDLGQKGGDKFKDLVTKRMISGEGAPVSMERMGGRKTEQTMGQGLYENFAKQLETNPMVGITIPRAGNLSTNKRLIADIGTAGQELGQEMVAAHKFTPLMFKNPKDATAMMIGGSEPLTKDQILKLSKSLPGMIVSHSPKNNSMFIAPFEGDALDYKKAAQAANEILGKGAKVQFGKADSTKDIMYRGDYGKMEARPPSAESTEMRNRLKKAEARIVRGPSVSQSQRQSPPSTLTSTVR